MTHLFRSLIFVPGNNPRFIEKARDIDADIVCFDLEDSVPAKEKKAARNMIADALKSRHSYASQIFVRTNSPASGNMPRDLEAIARRGLDGIVIPKVNSAADIKRIANILLSLEKKRRLKPISIMPSIESAKGVVNAYNIASSSRRISALVFGVFDLLNDMGMEYSKDSPGAGFARAKIPVDAAAAGVSSIDAIWQDLEDPKGLEKDCRAGKSLGYSGKSIIHPDQIHVTHRIFYPTKTELLWAETVCKSYMNAVKSGRGATKIDGKMIDEVHFKQAKTLLETAGRHVSPAKH